MIKHGEVETGSDSLQKVLDAPAQEVTRYRQIIAYVESNPALLQIGDGTVHRIPVPVNGLLHLGEGISINERIQAINASSGNNFTNLHVTVVQVG